MKNYVYGLNFNRLYLKKLIYSYVILIFVPVFFVGSILYNYSRSIIDEETIKYVNSYLEQTSDTLDEIVANAQSVFFQMALNKMTSDLVKKPQAYLSTYEGIEDYRNVIDIYKNLTVSNKYIDSFYIYSDTSKQVITSDNGVIHNDSIFFRSWIDNDFKNGNEIEWIAVKDKNTFGDQDKYYYSFRGRFLNSTFPGNDIVLLNLNVEQINSKVSQWEIKETGYIAVTDENGKILFFKDKSYLLEDIGKICDRKSIFSSNKGYYMDVINDQKTIVVYTTIGRLGWKEIALIPMTSITRKIDFMKRITLIVTLLSIIIAVMFSIFITSRIYKPMGVLLRGMKKAETGDLNVRITDSRKDEFGYLYNVFNGMIKKIDELVFDAYKLRLLNKDAELKALQAQINPHFLHNTLNSMYCMAKSYGINELSNMIYKLSEYFRLGFSFGCEEIEILEEINHVKLYVDIMAVRYVDKFGIDFDINDDLYNCKTLKYLIQPLVENSFNHGMKGRKNKLFITVKGRIVENAVRIQVVDNGVGIDDIKLQNIKISLEKKSVEGEYFALCNINSRIKLFYGEEYGIDISSMANEGTKVDIVIPVRRL